MWTNGNFSVQRSPRSDSTLGRRAPASRLRGRRRKATSLIGAVLLAALIPTSAEALSIWHLPGEIWQQNAIHEIERTCGLIGGKLGSVSTEECLDRHLRLSGKSSVEGTPILVREYPPVEARAPLGRVLLFGGIHGDEYAAVSIVFRWLSQLDRFHSGRFHWRVAPLVNPDGLLKRPRAQRMNANGVDLNRNFPSPNWIEESRDYWVRRTGKNPRRYPGTAPLSEPESRWLAEEIEKFQPDVIVSVHAPCHVLDFDGPPEPPQRLGPLRLHLMGTYPGSLGRYAGLHKGLPVVTIELPSAGIMPSPPEQQAIWTDLIGWLTKTLTGDSSTDSAIHTAAR